jgi:hypothetical protein
MKRTATATVREAQEARALAPARPGPAGAAPGAVEVLRRRLAGTTAREHVVLDFLEDDLRESRAAVAAVAAYLASVEGALAEELPTPERLLALARAVDPAAQVDYLQTVLASVRRRLSQVAARM